MKEINALIKKYNQGEELTKKELLEISLYQIKILDSNLPQWSKWNKKAKRLIVELLQEAEEIPTNKGMKKILSVGENTATICKICNGTTINIQAKDSKCHCIIGYRYDNKIKAISEEEYKKRAIKKYFKELSKKRLLSKYTEEEFLNMDLSDFLYHTKITTL